MPASKGEHRRQPTPRWSDPLRGALEAILASPWRRTPSPPPPADFTVIRFWDIFDVTAISPPSLPRAHTHSASGTWAFGQTGIPLRFRMGVGVLPPPPPNLDAFLALTIPLIPPVFSWGLSLGCSIGRAAGRKPGDRVGRKQGHRARLGLPLPGKRPAARRPPVHVASKPLLEVVYGTCYGLGRRC